MRQILFTVGGAYILQYIAAHMLINKPDVQVAYHETPDRDCESDEHKFQMMLGQSLSDCVIECALREHCAVMNYQTTLTLCELYQEEGNTVGNYSHPCISVLKNDTRLIKSPCNDNMACRYGETCDRTSRNCIFKECLDVPHVKNGQILGNHKDVGSRIRYKCNRGYKLADGSNVTAMCDNGQWSSHGKCVSADIGWADWSGWDTCSATCGGGSQTRSRTCTNPTPENGGHDCTGDETETENCKSQHCPADAVGNRCTKLPGCDDGNSRCLWKWSLEHYCHCNFGFEFNETLYSNDSSVFKEEPHTSLSNYNYNFGNQGESNNFTFTECVTFCSTHHPQFLSINFIPGSSSGLSHILSARCECKQISKQQYIKAHGNLPVGDDIQYSFYDRPCMHELN